MNVSEMHLDRQASSESAFQYSGNVFGSTGVDRERCYARRELHLYCSRQQSDGPFSLDKTSTSCVLLTPEGAVFDDPMELLRHARTRFRLTKTILLACEQFMKNVWHCTRNGFSARKLPAERSPEPKVLDLSSGMRQGAQTIVFVVPENETALELRVSSSENSQCSNHCIRSVWESPSAGSTCFVEPTI